LEVQQTTLSQLESHLWESANILQGPVDAAYFKTYIIALLCFLLPLTENISSLPKAIAALKKGADSLQAEDRLVVVMNEGGWLREFK
jgi:type I restriction-modification system DNA methylase subunit